MSSRENCLEFVVSGETAVDGEVERAHGRHGPEQVVDVVGDPPHPGRVRHRRERCHSGVDDLAHVSRAGGQVIEPTFVCFRSCGRVKLWAGGSPVDIHQGLLAHPRPTQDVKRTDASFPTGNFPSL
jgi:hypothetical protein